MSTPSLYIIPCLQDNYGFLLHDKKTGEMVAVDTPDSQALQAFIEKKRGRLTQIWNTHHHGDHTGGNLALKDIYGAKITGPAREAEKIKGLDHVVGEGDRVSLGNTDFHVLETPGHTLGHCVYYAPSLNMAFVGDCLFVLGCGRLFEGTPQMMLDSLGKLSALPEDTKLYCAHEYTRANARFARHVDRDNKALQERAKHFQRLRAENRPTIPTTVREECATNPFLRAHDPALARAVGCSPGSSPVSVFAALRAFKDVF